MALSWLQLISQALAYSLFKRTLTKTIWKPSLTRRRRARLIWQFTCHEPGNSVVFSSGDEEGVINDCELTYAEAVRYLEAAISSQRPAPVNALLHNRSP